MSNVPVIEVFMNGAKVGRIAMTTDGLCAFEYDAEWLASGVSISPYYLPLRREVFVAKRSPFNGNFGVFDDSLPDGWGSLVLDRYLRSQGKDPARLTALQRLALVGSTGRGALEYRPDMSTISEEAAVSPNVNTCLGVTFTGSPFIGISLAISMSISDFTRWSLE